MLILRQHLRNSYNIVTIRNKNVYILYGLICKTVIRIITGNGILLIKLLSIIFPFHLRKIIHQAFLPAYIVSYILSHFDFLIKRIVHLGKRAGNSFLLIINHGISCHIINNHGRQGRSQQYQKIAAQQAQGNPVFFLIHTFLFPVSQFFHFLAFPHFL